MSEDDEDKVELVIDYRQRLRAPADWPGRLLSEPGVSALNLACAEIRGDFQFLSGSRSEGSIAARGARIRGDVWMSGATIHSPDGPALFFQGTTIDGMLALDGRQDAADKSGTNRPFMCFGDLNLTAAEVGRDFLLDRSVIRGHVRFFDLTVKNDLFFGAHVDGSIAMTGCRIGGSVSLSHLTLGASSKEFSLDYGHIGRSLQLIRSTEAERLSHRLLAAREKTLQCLPGVALVETLWDFEDSPGERMLAQIGFLKEVDAFYMLDGTVTSLDIAGRSLGDDAAALEYMKLHCTYVQESKRASPFIAGPRPGERPRFLASVRSRNGKTLGRLDKNQFRIELTRTQEDFTLSACFLQRDSLCRKRFRMAVSEKAFEMETLEEAPFGPPLVGMPRVRGPLFLHPESEEADPALLDAASLWVLPATLPEMLDYDETALEANRGKLTLQLFSNISLRGKVSLENLYCDTLDDRAGCFWGTDVRIDMNHFVYNRTTWEPDPEEGVERAYRRLWTSFMREVRRGAAWGLRPLAARFGWTDRLGREPPPTPWQTKLNWIYRQFDTSKLPTPRHYRIGPGEYRPQPFEQAIKVARTEGREDYAIHFEIEKRNIEWRLFTWRHRGRFLALGVLAAAAWMIVPRDNVTWSTMGTAGLLLVSFAVSSDVSHFAMRTLFGHLRRPIRAIATLAGAFLIGWAGVDAANDRGMLVIDVAPVAALVGEGENSGVIGSQLAAKNLARNVPCGDNINEALYALDVLIPLIDLREESRCEVGEAAVPRNRPDIRDGVLGTLESWPRKPTDFWDVLKALYAIAGWFIVSLSILTFAHTNRARGEPS